MLKLKRCKVSWNCCTTGFVLMAAPSLLGSLIRSPGDGRNSRPTLTLIGCRSSYFQLFYATWLAEVYVLHKDVSVIDTSLVDPPAAPQNPKAISSDEIELIKDSMCQGMNTPGGITSAKAMLNYYHGWVDNETWCPVEAADT